MNENLGIYEALQARRVKFARFIAPPNRTLPPAPPTAAASSPFVPAVPPPKPKPLPVIPAEPLELVHAGPSIAQVQRAFCDAMAEAGYTIESRPYGMRDLLSPLRPNRISHPRHVCIDLISRICRVSSTAIGKQFFNLDHTSVLHAFKRTPHHLARDPLLAAVHAQVLAHFEAKQ